GPLRTPRKSPASRAAPGNVLASRRVAGSRRGTCARPARQDRRLRGSAGTPRPRRAPPPERRHRSAAIGPVSALVHGSGTSLELPARPSASAQRRRAGAPASSAGQSEGVSLRADAARILARVLQVAYPLP